LSRPLAFSGQWASLPAKSTAAEARHDGLLAWASPNGWGWRRSGADRLGSPKNHNRQAAEVPGLGPDGSLRPFGKGALADADKTGRNRH
jgi:hypothetical protein